MIIKTDFIPSNFDAITIWPFIFIKKSKANNSGLIEHELVHFREQAWITPIWWFKYLLSKDFRLQAELRAYKRQIDMGGITIADASKNLIRYKLDITEYEALEALKA